MTSTLAFFSQKGGVGKTSLVYHLGWTFADEGLRVLMVDLDWQSELTTLCVDEERLEQLWTELPASRKSIRGAVEPILEDIGDVQPGHVEVLSPRLALLPGDIRIADLEAKLSDAWQRCMNGDAASFRAISGFYRIIQATAAAHDADVVLIDMAPSMGAINRSALIAADKLALPINTDLISIQSLRVLGPALKRLREEWHDRLALSPALTISLPAGRLEPIGYIVVQVHLSGRLERDDGRWWRAIPEEYARAIHGAASPAVLPVEQDPCCLAVLPYSPTLMPMAHVAKKPIFKLTAADGALGAHSQAVRDVGNDFRKLAAKIRARL